MCGRMNMASNSPGLNSTMESADVSRAPRIVFLLLFMISSFVGSLFILIVLAHNVKLRVVQNILIANLCVICIIDCVFNMSLVLGSLLVDEWVYGAFMCKVNNFFMNLVAIQTILMLAAFSIDRYFSIRFSYKYEAWLSSYRLWLASAYLWLHSFLFSIPFLTEAVTSSFRPQLHLCTFTGATSVGFLYSTLLISFLGPLIIIIVFHIIYLRLAWKLRYIKRADMVQKNYTQMLNETSTDSQHFRTSCSFTVTLFILWTVLEIPFIITCYIKQYEYSQSLEEGTVISYPWELDATFIWMRFFYCSLVPPITFIFKKDIWQSTKECLLCRRHNSVTDMEIKGVVPIDTIKKENSLNSEKAPSPKTKDKDNNEIHHPLVFNVPVLFATSTGICIEDSSVGCSPDSTIPSLPTMDIIQLKGKTLDITYPEYEYADELVGDTSDYDSSCEIDQYSSSQPVSTKNVQGTLHRTRSMSDPEISSCPSLSQEKSKTQDLAGTLGADSGLDLSGTANSVLASAMRSGSSKTLVDSRACNSSDDYHPSTKSSPAVNTRRSEIRSPGNKVQQGEETQGTDARTDNIARHTGFPVARRSLAARLKPLEKRDAESSHVKAKRKRHKHRKTEIMEHSEPPRHEVSDSEPGENLKVALSGLQIGQMKSPGRMSTSQMKEEQPKQKDRCDS